MEADLVNARQNTTHQILEVRNFAGHHLCSDYDARSNSIRPHALTTHLVSAGTFHE